MDNKYIQSANLNGEPYNKTSISHAAILEGGELVFEMGRQELKDKR
jgi:putative alpha-1,2-mannosidase